MGVERQLPGDIIFGVRYVGSRGSKLFANQQYNYFNGVTGARLNATRGAINLRGNYADSNYNGLEVSGTYNLRHGLLIRGNYAYSKSLDDGSEIFTLGTDSTSYSANLAPGGRGQDWGPSAFDHRHFFSVAYLYTVPGLHSSNHMSDLAEEPSDQELDALRCHSAPEQLLCNLHSQRARSQRRRQHLQRSSGRCE